MAQKTFRTIAVSAICLYLTAHVESLVLPFSLKPCRRGPALDECIIKTTNAAVDQLVKGDPKYKMPVLDPFVIKQVSTIDSGKKSISMNVTLTDAKFKGLKNGKMVKSKFDLDKMHIEITVEVPKITIDSQYEVSGKFLVLPIVGKGPAFIELDDVSFTFNCDYRLIKVKGEDHISITSSDLKYNTSKVTVDLKNLFNGDAMLGKSMNEALNDNWKELNNALGPGIARAVGQVVATTFDEITKEVPYKEIVLQ